MLDTDALPQFSFVKMQGLGNDFVVIDLRLPENEAVGRRLGDDVRASRWICDRRWGLGADQILTVSDPLGGRVSGRVRMEIWNADGSQAEMCGNGVRAVALFSSAREIETGAGVIEVERLGDEWRVEMGVPQSTGLSESLAFAGGAIEVIPVSVGNPHAVVFVDDVLQLDAAEFAGLGRAVENHARFAPERANVEFVQVVSPTQLLVRVWERGAGATLACGTGACAALVAAVLSGRAQAGVRVDVILPGGKLGIEWAGTGSAVWMTGPAAVVAQGQWLATDPYWKVD